MAKIIIEIEASEGGDTLRACKDCKVKDLCKTDSLTTFPVCDTLNAIAEYCNGDEAVAVFGTENIKSIKLNRTNE